MWYFFIYSMTVINFNCDITLVQGGRKGAENKTIYFSYFYFINWNFCEMSSRVLFNYISTLSEKRYAATSCLYIYCVYFFFDILTPTQADIWRSEMTLRVASGISHRYVIYGTFLTPSRWRRIGGWSVSTTKWSMMASRRTLPLFHVIACHPASHPGRPITHRYSMRAAKLTVRKISTLFIARSRLSFTSSSDRARYANIISVTRGALSVVLIG